MQTFDVGLVKSDAVQLAKMVDPNAKKPDRVWSLTICETNRAFTSGLSPHHHLPTNLSGSQQAVDCLLCETVPGNRRRLVRLGSFLLEEDS